MKMSRNIGFPLLLIGCGLLIGASQLGLNVNGVIHFLFPFLLIGIGYIGMKYGRKWLGWGLMILGILIIFGKLSSLIGWMIAAVMIGFGVMMLKRKAY